MVNRKLLRENGKGNFFGVCLVGYKNKWRGLDIFSLADQKVFSPKWREN